MSGGERDRPAVAIVRHCHDYELDVRREAEALVAAGARCDVLYLGRRGRPLVEVVGGVTLRRVPGVKTRGGAVRYTFEYVWFVVAAAVMLGVLQLRHRYRAVQTNTMPDLVVFSAVVPKLCGARVVAFMQEPVPELAETVGAGPGTVRLLAAVEQRAMAFADRSITVTGALQQRFASRGADPDRIAVVRNGPDPGHLLLPEPDRRPRHGQPGRLVAICHGTIEDRYGHDVLIDAVALAAPDIADLQVVITGRGAGTGAMVARISERGVGDVVRFEGWVSDERLGRLLHDADVGIVAQKASPYAHLVHTNKLYDYWIAGLPVVASRLAATEAEFDDGTVAYFEPGDPADLARQLVRLANDGPARRELAAAGRRAYERVGWHAERQRYLAVYRELIPELGPGVPRTRGPVTAADPDLGEVRTR